MILRHSLIIMSLVFFVSCSDNKPSEPTTNKENISEIPQEALPEEATTEVIMEKDVEVNKTEATNTTDTNEQYKDYYTSTIIQEIKNQISNDPLLQERKIQNVEFANRIYKVNFTPGNHSKLSLISHTNKPYHLAQVAQKNKTQYFSLKNDEIHYSAEAKTINHANGTIVSIIKVNEHSTPSQIYASFYIFYIKKTGTVSASFMKGHDYSKDISKTSKVFLARLIENPSVEGEFYSIITDDNASTAQDRNISSASRFKLTISDNFTLESHPLNSNVKADLNYLIPLTIDYKSFWKIFFGGSTAYTVIKNPSYHVESLLNPAELTAFNLVMKIDGSENADKIRTPVPLGLFIKFKSL